MDHADNVVGLAAPQGYAAVGTDGDLLDDLEDRQVGIDRDDLLSMDHDFVHGDGGQIEHAAQHDVAVLFVRHEFLVGHVQLDGAAQFRHCLFGRALALGRDAEHA